jgi:hypothetical protein
MLFKIFFFVQLLKMLDPDPDSMNLDPKPCFQVEKNKNQKADLVDGETVEGVDVVHYGEQQHLAWRRLLECHSFKKMGCVSFDKYNVEQNTSVPLVPT